MASLLNADRPPVFCPGCSHERVLQALDQAFQNMGLRGDQVVMVSDIGCSGLFDTFFNTHALHGLHGRALTYATGIKLARPELQVVVTMGDGGLGIGGAHVLSACRRNLDLTLLVLNNFNYGMTGGQCSATTPQEARVASGFLNRLEKPLDICQVAGTAGAGWVMRASSYERELPQKLQAAIGFEGFSVVDIWGICPGRYTRKNKLSPKAIESALAGLPPVDEVTTRNARPEYGRAYRAEAVKLSPPPPPLRIASRLRPPSGRRQEVVLLGSAGQRILTAGELLCLAGVTAGLQASQKNDYPITVMRGHSVSEVILCREAIGYTGIETPSLVIALAAEGVIRFKTRFSRLDQNALVLKAAGLDLPPLAARVQEIDFRGLGIKSPDWALAALACLAQAGRVLSREMLQAALEIRFSGATLEHSRALIASVAGQIPVSPSP